MKLAIKSLKGIEFQGEAVSLNLKTASGEITVLDHHRPLITLLVSGIATIGHENGEEKKIEIQSGFLEVDNKNNVVVLVD